MSSLTRLILFIGLVWLLFPLNLNAAALTLTVPATAFPKDTIIVSGSAQYQAAPLNHITIEIAGVGTFDALVQGNGQYSIQVNIPVDVVGGAHNVKAASSVTNEVVLSQISILPKLTVNSATGRPGEQFALTGSGFIPNTPIALYIYNNNYGISPANINPMPIVSPPPISSSSGALDLVVNVPQYPQGVYSIVGSDNRNLSGPLNFTIQPSIKLPETQDSTVYAEGNQIKISGTGFAAGSVITFKIDSIALSGYTAASLADGSFSTTLTLPALSRGYHNITAVDAAKNGSPIASFAFGTSIQVIPASGTMGGTVTVKGSGFNGIRPIIVTYDGLPLVTNPAVITSAASGSFSATFVVPVGAPVSEHNVIATDGENTAAVTFTTSLTATINPVTSISSPGYVGQELTVDGKGFNPGGIVSIKYDTAQVASANASALGAFNVKFKIKASAAGTHVITVTDGINIRTFPYIMESTPPVSPSLLSPPDRAVTKKPIIFEWDPVSDASGITYKFQLSQDPTFSTTMVEQSGLDSPTYTLDTTTTLASNGNKNTYYWRVVAVDGARNSSEPSDVRSFVIGSALSSFPPFLLFFVGAVSPVLLVGIVVVSFRRFAPKKVKVVGK